MATASLSSHDDHRLGYSPAPMSGRLCVRRLRLVDFVERRSAAVVPAPALRAHVASAWVLAFTLALLLGLVASVASARGQATTDTEDTDLERAVEYMIAQQQIDGGFLGFSGESDPGVTTDAIIALAAARAAGLDVDDPLTGAQASLEVAAAAYAGSGQGQAAKVALAAVALGADPRAFARLDLIALATGTGGGGATPVAGLPGVYGDDLYDHALVLLAQAAAGEPVPDSAVDALRAAQLADGSWAFAGTTEAGGGDSNTTALLVQALVAAGHGADPMVPPAMDYLRSVQAESGGAAFAVADPLVPDANSTALVVQAILATGGDSASTAWRDAGGALAAFQNPSGGFRYQDADPTDNLFATLQAIPAMAGQALPVGPRCGEAATPSATAEVAYCIPLAQAA